MSDRIWNWAGNLEFKPARFHQPSSTEELQTLVAACKKAKALGTGHAFTPLADTDANLISMRNFNKIVEINASTMRVTVEAGIKYGELCQALNARGLALRNMASLPHITVAGACLTATHGSGVQNGNLSTAVTGFEFVSADGELLSLSRSADGELFDGAVVNLGAIGIVSTITLELVPTFDVRQEIYENLPFADLETHFDDVMSSGYSVSMFFDWRAPKINQIWVKRLVTDDTPAFEPGDLFGAPSADADRNPIPGASAANCTDQMGIGGPWHTRLPHFRMEFTPSNGEELQTEYFVPRNRAFEAMGVIYGLRERVSPLLYVSEIRTIAADRLWMSPCRDQDCVALHFTWKKNEPEVRKLLPDIEAGLAPFGARPHWAKLFAFSPAQLQNLYPRLPEFRQLVESFDPEGKFRNEFLATYLF